MVDKEKEPSQLTSAESSNTNSSLANNINTNLSNRQARRFDKSKAKCLSPNAKVNGLAIKIYDEQLPKGWDTTSLLIKNVDKKKYYVIAIKHDKDTYAEDGCFWKPAREKHHYHILFKCANRKDRIHVYTVLNMLGICFRPGLDDALWRNHGVETIVRFDGYTVYLTHETEKAIADGKELYDLTELVSNLSIEEIEQIRDGYMRFSDGLNKLRPNDLIELDSIAHSLGLELKNFDDWYNTLPFSARSSAKMKTIRESYDRGTQIRLTKDRTILRLPIFIQGEHNVGKTYAALDALRGKRVHTVDGGGTGKFDRLRADHEAIVISDDICPNLLNMADNYICQAYKRNSNNPIWAGQYFVVTSNLSFEDWVRQCGIRNSEHIEALKSRFYICEVKNKNDVNSLLIKSVCVRGKIEEQKERTDMFVNFKSKYDACLASYNPDTSFYDNSWLIDDEYKVIESKETKSCDVNEKFEKKEISNKENENHKQIRIFNPGPNRQY